LKDTVGQPVMTARLIRQDNVTWECTHSLFVTTNYRPRRS
jgi:putative DNA primase/helicase